MHRQEISQRVGESLAVYIRKKLPDIRGITYIVGFSAYLYLYTVSGDCPIDMDLSVRVFPHFSIIIIAYFVTMSREPIRNLKMFFSQLHGFFFREIGSFCTSQNPIDINC